MMYSTVDARLAALDSDDEDGVRTGRVLVHVGTPHAAVGVADTHDIFDFLDVFHDGGCQALYVNTRILPNDRPTHSNTRMAHSNNPTHSKQNQSTLIHSCQVESDEMFGRKLNQQLHGWMIF